MERTFQTALITGASGGIGYELAKCFASHHYNLILVARNDAKLSDVAQQLGREFKVMVKTVPLDLSLPAAPQFLAEGLEREGLSVDILVNNAGYGKMGEFAELSIEDSYGQIQVNIAALTLLTKLFLGPMIGRGSGKILNVASTAGFQPGPLMAVYYATKAYVISFSEALANELAKSGVTVTCLCPGPTDTDFQHRAGNDRSRLFQQLAPMRAESVARKGYEGLMGGKTLVIPGFRNWLVAESVRLAPKKVVAALSRWISEPAK
jgi:short-subunit dehydrogenase